VKHIEADKIRKGNDCGLIASVMKDIKAQYPWLKHGLLYHLIDMLDGVINDFLNTWDLILLVDNKLL
jgi:hypothetical protein